MNDSFDPDFGTALAAASAIRARQISSRELTDIPLPGSTPSSPTQCLRLPASRGGPHDRGSC
jgi:hypothetical protein